MRSRAIPCCCSLMVLVACTGKGTDSVRPHPTDSGGSDTSDTSDTTDTGDTTETGDTTDTSGEVTFADATVSLATGSFTNLLLPYSVAVDSAHRRLWVTSLFDDVLGEVNIDDDRLLAVYTLPEDEYGLPAVVVDGNGDAWVPGEAAVVKVTAAGEITSFPRDAASRNALGAPGGGLFVSSDVGSSASSQLDLLDSDGEVVASASLAKSVVALADAGEGVVGVSAVDEADVATIELYASDTLEHLGTCEGPFLATGLFPLDNGDFFVFSDNKVGYARCDGSEPVVVQVGEENKFAVVHEDGFTVFDRIGEDATGGRSLGIARRLDLELAVTNEYGTGKHSGFGGLDEETGVAWLNSEGTTEVRAYNMDAGRQVAAVPLGSHVEGFAVSDQVGVAWVTGRLSGLIARVDFSSGVVVHAPGGPLWPVSPLARDGWLYALDQIEGVVYVYDAETMLLSSTWPLGVAQNDDLDFDDLVFSESRGSLLVAVGQANTLVELDAETGLVLERFQLGGAAPPAGTTVGRLEVVTQGDVAWVVRSTDSTATRVDFASREVTSAVLATEAQISEAQYDLAPKLTWLSADGARLYWGTWAFDPLALTALPGRALDGTRVIGEVDGAFVTWDASTGSVLLGPPGEPAQDIGSISVTGGDPYVRWLPEWGGGVMYVDAFEVTIGVHDIVIPS